MSIETVASSSKDGDMSSKKEKKVRLIDGRPETKEERQARKAAKKEAKSHGASSADHEPTHDSQQANTVTDTAVKKEKKRKREKAEDVEQIPETKSSQADGSVAGEQNGGGNSSELEVKKKSKKSKKQDVGSEADRKGDESDNMDDSAPATEEGNAVEKKKKKKKDKSKVNASNLPAEGGTETADAGPSEVARKAISYVSDYISHTEAIQAGKHSTQWKFNKANQNWLIRNIWNETEIPEEHVEAVMQYLNSIKGGGRTNLVEEARKRLEIPPVDPGTKPLEAEGEDTPKNPDEVDESDQTVRQRAKTLIKLLESSN